MKSTIPTLAVFLGIGCAAYITDWAQVKAAIIEKIGPTIATFEIDPALSKFVAHAHRGGLAWFKGRDHYDAVRKFSGEASLSLDALNAASLVMRVDANSLEETGEKFTETQRAIIGREIKEIVLESEKYPEITFRSTSVSGAMKNGAFQVDIAGDIDLHGVTKRITIPAAVTISGNSMEARGTFDLKRSDFGIKTTSAFHGWVRVKDTIIFDFDIIAHLK